VTDSSAAATTFWTRFFEVYESLPRGGPGDPGSARRALALMNDLPAGPRVLDLGCGPGRGSTELARLTGGRVTALDRRAPFVRQQAAAARQSGLANRLDPICADMRAAPFAAASFDLVWSEGALYNVGFVEGLVVCRDLVRPGGYVAVSEAVWTVADPPDEIRDWWHAAYPEIASIEAKAADVAGAGLDVIAHFTLPASAWSDCYYSPIRERLSALRTAWARDEYGLAVMAELDTEMAMFERWGHTYSYEFFVGRRPRR
jgi:SAM-dependent methyltransferase